ncbi:MoaD/ThiS family protein [Algoriphagus confluentis]
MMSDQIKIKAFGMIADKMGQEEIRMLNPGSTDLLLHKLYQDFPQLESMKFGLAINKKLCSEPTSIPHEAELALLPPFSGG